MAIEIVDFPINSMVIFHCYVAVHQRVFGPWLQWLPCGFLYAVPFVGHGFGSITCGTIFVVPPKWSKPRFFGHWNIASWDSITIALRPKFGQPRHFFLNHGKIRNCCWISPLCIAGWIVFLCVLQFCSFRSHRFEVSKDQCLIFFHVIPNNKMTIERFLTPLMSEPFESEPFEFTCCTPTIYNWNYII